MLRLDGKLISSISLQNLNAPSPISVTLSAMVTVLSIEQFSKANAPIFVTPFEIVTLVMLSQFSKA